MKITKFLLIVSLFTIMLLGGFAFGYLKGLEPDDNTKIDITKSNINSINNNTNNNEDDKEINIQYIISYNDKDGVEKVDETLPKELFNANENELKSFIGQKHPNWIVNEIKKLSDEMIVVHTIGKVSESVNENKEFKFKAGVYKGEIVIFKIYSDGTEEIYKHTYRSIDTIREEDKNTFIEGKIFDTEDEVTNFIENYIS